MANLVSTAFSSDYAWYETMHGAAYYELTRGGVLKKPGLPGGSTGPESEKYTVDVE